MQAVVQEAFTTKMANRNDDTDDSSSKTLPTNQTCIGSVQGACTRKKLMQENMTLSRNLYFYKILYHVSPL